MKAFEKFLKITTWLAWAAFVYGLVTLEKPSAASILCLIFSATWLTTGIFMKEELAGDDA